MQVMSVNLGKIREMAWKGRTFNTAIFKEAVLGKVPVGLPGLVGDQHANSENHGGRLKALFAYPYEHYTEFWHSVLADSSSPYGSFGENVTTQDWLDDRVYVGEKYRIGTAVVMVTIPRKPCYKLNARLGRDDVLPKYLESKHTGFYLAVIEEGEIGAGDAINLLESHRLRVTPRDIVNLYLGHCLDRELLERVVKLEFVTDRMRESLIQRFDRFARHSEEESGEF